MQLVALLDDEGSPVRDAYGIPFADLVDDASGTSLVEASLRDGRAIVAPSPPDHLDLTALWAAENDARLGRRGVWAPLDSEADDAVLAAPFPLPAARLSEHLDQYDGRMVVFRGMVEDVGFTKKSIWVNFGTDWRTDTTLRLLPKEEEQFPWLTPDLAGNQLECRGVVRQYYGAVIDVRHPAACRLLPPDASTQAPTHPPHEGKQ
ncbi:MAG: hypothetical protein K0U36_04590 [Alphaproteobacteria bacterium]|nr:hypothetical protein [Alphaproteobacteria bacterium]